MALDADRGGGTAQPKYPQGTTDVCGEHKEEAAVDTIVSPRDG